MKNPFSNETVKSAAIVIGSAVAFIAISKGIGAIRKKYGSNPKVKAIFGSAENADSKAKYNIPRNSYMEGMEGMARHVSLSECEQECRCESAG